MSPVSANREIDGLVATMRERMDAIAGEAYEAGFAAGREQQEREVRMGISAQAMIDEKRALAIRDEVQTAYETAMLLRSSIGANDTRRVMIDATTIQLHNALDLLPLPETEPRRG